MAVLSIDPGTRTGGCLMPAAGPPIAFAIESPTIWQIYRIENWAFTRRQTGEPLELVVEDQHVARGPRANPASTITLARNAERWIVVAEQLGIPWSRVRPASWHTALAEVPKHDDEGEVLTPKQRAVILVRRLWPSLPFCRGEIGRDELEERATSKLPQDPVEAIVMARWRVHGAGRTRREAPRKRGKR